MSYVIWENEMNALWSVERQLHMLVSMANPCENLALPADGFACMLEQLEQQLTKVRENAEERLRLGQDNRLGAHAQAQVIRVLSGQESIFGRDLNSLTQRLRKYAEADEDMIHVRNAWEDAWEHIGSSPETTSENARFGFRKRQAEHGQGVEDGR